jgi:hypothetical protein
MGQAEPQVPIFYFTQVKNVGDQVNIDLVNWLFGREAVLSSQSEKHLLAIGSLMSIANAHSQIWGTGVLHPSFPVSEIPAKHIHALRGKLSWHALRDKGIQVGDVPLGDPAFLVSKSFFDPQISKRYRLGVAAHYVDRLHPWVEEILTDPDVADLNVHADPSDFLQMTLECEAVISSSLHGLIFAEALRIPNLWIKLSNNVLGEGFKFRDWFSLADCPQKEPDLPRSEDTAKSLAARTFLHDMRIDQESLVGSFPFAGQRRWINRVDTPTG